MKNQVQRKTYSQIKSELRPIECKYSHINGFKDYIKTYWLSVTSKTKNNRTEI